MDGGTLLLGSRTGPNVKEGLQDFSEPPDQGMVTVLLKTAFPVFFELGNAGVLPLGAQIDGLYVRTFLPRFEYNKEGHWELAGASKAFRRSRIPESSWGVPGSSKKSGTPGWCRDTPKEGVVQI